MCGIAGIFAYRDSGIDRAELESITESMRNRGPDDSGRWYSDDSRVGFGHRRLAIIELSSSGHQPMTASDGKTVIIFNGEIYNYAELRERLAARGVAFRTHSDTEVLLEMYRAEGTGMLNALRGMFAFALWDGAARRLVLARDPYGIKPLYFADDGKSIRVASQVRALMAGGKISKEIDPAATAGFFLTGTIPEPFTLYRGIRAVPAGSWIQIDESGVSPPFAYYSIARTWRDAAAAHLNRDEAIDLLHTSVRESVRYHLVSDVPVGAFLSAGVDSGTLVGLARECGATSELRTITLSFEELLGTGMDEAPLAEKTAATYGTNHTTRLISRLELESALPRVLESMDQPSIDGVNSWFVSKAAAESGLKVALSGLGGDELFGSYPSFRDVPRMVRLLSLPSRIPILREVLSGLFHLSPRKFSPKFRGLARYGGTYAGAYFLRRGMFLPEDLPSVMGASEAREGLERLQLLGRIGSALEPDPGGPYARVATLEASFYLRNQLLRDTDWASMAHSLEVRVPLVDAHILRKIAPALITLGSESKQLYAQAVREPLPKEVRGRRKTGFNVPLDRVIKGHESLGAVSRQWGREVWAAFSSARFRVLYLTTDAYGGHGGIGLYNRDLLQALSDDPRCSSIVTFPRNAGSGVDPIPPKVTWRQEATKGKLHFAWHVLRESIKREPFDFIVCGHINLLSIAWMASRLTGAPLVLMIYGIDAWVPPGRVAAAIAPRVPSIISISQHTMDKFLAWSRARGRRFILPNAIHLEWYAPGPKSDALLDRYNLRGKTVLMTFGRMVSSERYKGFDEVMEILPALRKKLGDVAYLLCGSGADQARLEKKVEALGLSGLAIFTGPVAESEKNDHYRLADAYVMPSRGEGFGFVFLEALASGVPAVGSKLDGSREALLDGELGLLVDPARPDEIMAAVEETLQKPHKVPERLSFYSYQAFEQRTRGIVDTLLAEARRPTAR
jgi:asparagine synthase (glutamine-hydrolysing)